MKLERDYQSKLITKLKKAFPKTLVLKNDAGYIQGIPDLLILNGPKWALIEIKRDRNSATRPNQGYYIEWANTVGGFGTIVHPGNEVEVMKSLRKYFLGSVTV